MWGGGGGDLAHCLAAGETSCKKSIHHTPGRRSLSIIPLGRVASRSVFVSMHMCRRRLWHTVPVLRGK